jgi:tetratricopeptide (TPR) repeat protein
MRATVHAWPKLLGLLILGCQLAAAPQALGWENPLRGWMRKSAPTADAQAATARYHAVEPAAGTDGPRTGSVQLASWDAPPQQHARSRPPAGQQLPRVASSPKTSLIPEDYELRMPGMPFMRSGGGTKQTRSAPTNANAAVNRRIAPTASTSPTTPPGSGRPIAKNWSGERHVVTPPTASRAIQPVHPNHPAQPIRPMGNQTSTPAKLMPVPEPAPLKADAAVAQQPATPAAQSPADKLMLQAHELAAKATTEEDYTNVIATCRRARASHPGSDTVRYANELAGWALNRRGQLKAESGRFSEALLDFDDAIRSDGECWRAIHNRGLLLAQDGQFEAAFDDFNRAVQVNPQFAKAYSNRAALFVVSGNLLPALQDYQRAIEFDPDLAVAHRGRGRVCHLLGRLDEAIAHYDAAVQLAPSDAYAIASRADLLTDMGRYVDAAADYDRAIQLDPSSAHPYRGSAWLLATCPDESVRNPTLAVARAQVAVELDRKQDAVSFDTLAAAQASSGDFHAAAKTLRRAIDIAPGDEREVYQDRLALYQRAKPYRISPVRDVRQASYEAESRD